MLSLGRTGWRLDPWREIETLGREMDKLFPRAYGSPAGNFPLINVFASENDVIITSELPGIDVKDVDLSVTGDTLTLKGTRKPPEVEKGLKWHRRERTNGSFYRTIQLPYNVDGNKVEAAYQKGILKITLPRAEADKPHKISVKTGE